MTAKAYTTLHQNLKLNYEDRAVSLNLTSGRGGLSLSLRYADQFKGIGTNLTVAQARELVADLLERADEIDANGGDAQ